MAGNYNFTPGSNPSATISNAGHITVAQAGLAALVAPNAVNSGTITANVSKITMASGDSYTVDLVGDGLINLQASPAITQQLVKNTGTLNAGNGGTVTLTAAAATNVVDSLINLGGITEATNINVSNQSGDVEVSSNIINNTGHDANVDIAACRNITVDPGVQISSSTGKMNVTLDSNDANVGSGAIYMANLSGINSNGGNIVLGGGTNPLTGYAVGNTTPGIDPYGNQIYSNGIFLEGAGLNADGGTITLHGMGIDPATSGYWSIGIRTYNTPDAGVALTTLGNGTISLNGMGRDNVYGDSTGIEMDGAYITSDHGAITLNGTGGNAILSTGIEAGYAAIGTDSGNININGAAGGLQNSISIGVSLGGGTINNVSGGVISITGRAGAGIADTGVYLAQEYITANAGSLAINGSGTDRTPGSTIGVGMYNSQIWSSGQGLGAAPVSIVGSGSGGGVDIQSSNITTVDGNVTILGTAPSPYQGVTISPDSQLISEGRGKFTIISNGHIGNNFTQLDTPVTEE